MPVPVGGGGSVAPPAPPTPVPNTLLTQLRAQVRAIADVDINDVTDAEIDTYLNDGYQEALGEDPWPFLMKRVVFNPIPNQSDYVLSDIASDLEVHRIQYVTTQGIKLDQLEPFFYFEFEPHGLATPTTGQYPTHWTVLDGTKLVLWPAPVVTDEVQIVYLATPSDLAADTNFPARYQYVLKWGGLRFVYQKIGDIDNFQLATQQFNSGMQQMRSELANANARPLIVIGSRDIPRKPHRLRFPFEA